MSISDQAWRAPGPTRQAACLPLVAAFAFVLALVRPLALGAQSRVGADSTTRLGRYGHDLLYGTALGFVYAGVDQLRHDPREWGDGWHGYQKRLASDVGEFAVQETVTDAFAAALDRPLDYQRCTCHATDARLGWALAAAVTDRLPDGHRSLALPRIVGAFAGSVAQASWRPTPPAGRARVTIINGLTSLVIGAGINVYHELRR